MALFGSATRRAVAHDPVRGLFDAIGRFLSDQHLDIEPANYAFAYRVLSAPESPLARTVGALTDGRVRLSASDIASLMGSANGPAANTNAPADRAAELVAQTQAQIHDFTGLMDRMRQETSGFGRDLAKSVDAIDPAAAPELVQLTASMLARVHSTEARLEAARTEAETLREQLEKARVDARSDALTTLPNRRALAEEFARRAAAGERMCLAVCDIDNFKDLNDRFGHAVGDRMLCAIGNTLAETCQNGFVARYGGEEFAVLFAGADVAAAADILDRARAAVAAKRYRMRDDATPIGTVTFSGGIVAVPRKQSFADAFNRADALLYRAKSEGRNQIIA